MKELSDRQRKFAHLVLKQVPAGRAYEQAGYKARGKTADEAASRLLSTNVKVQDYLEEMRAEARKAAQMEADELLVWLAEAIRKPVGEVDEMDPHCQEWTREELGGPAGQLKRGDAPSGNEVGMPTVWRTKVKMVSKMEAAKQIAAMMGWNKPAPPDPTAMDGLANLLRLVRQG